MWEEVSIMGWEHWVQGGLFGGLCGFLFFCAILGMAQIWLGFREWQRNIRRAQALRELLETVDEHCLRFFSRLPYHAGGVDWQFIFSRATCQAPVLACDLIAAFAFLQRAKQCLEIAGREHLTQRTRSAQLTLGLTFGKEGCRLLNVEIPPVVMELTRDSEES